MSLDTSRMERLTRDLPSKSAKIRTLSAEGYERADIARFLKVRYQQVRNVLVRESARTAVASAGSIDAAAGSMRTGQLQLGPGGRIVIPAAIREAMEIEEGGTLLAELDDGELRLITPRAALRRARQIVRRRGTGSDDLVEALIEERRAEALREEEDG